MKRTLNTPVDLIDDDELAAIGLHIREQTMARCNNATRPEAIYRALVDVLRDQYRTGTLSIDNLCAMAAHGMVYPTQGWRTS